MARKKKKKHVILVDDDPAICKIAQKILESAGFTVETYRSFRPMLSRLGEITPELLIVDLNVPDCSGFQFLQLSKKEEGLVNSPILVMSGRKDRDSVVKSISLGAGDYVVKPFTTKSLLQKVRKVIFSRFKK